MQTEQFLVQGKEDLYGHLAVEVTAIKMCQSAKVRVGRYLGTTWDILEKFLWIKFFLVIRTLLIGDAIICAVQRGRVLCRGELAKLEGSGFA